MAATPWAKFDPARALHFKLRKAGFAARGLDEAAICMSVYDGSDGFVSEDTVETLALGHGERKWRPLVKLLVDVGRWEPAEGGWVIHDYEEFNQSEAYWRARIEKRAEAGRKGGKASGAARARPLGEANAQASASPSAVASTQAAPLRSGAEPPPTPEGWVGGGLSNTGGATHDAIAEPVAAAEGLDEPIPDIETLALAKLADQRIARSTRRIDNPGGYRRSVLARLRDEHAGRLADWRMDHAHQPRWTPQMLADWLEPPKLPERSSAIPVAFDRPPCDAPDCDHGWIQAYDEHDEPIGVAPCPQCMPAAARAG